MRIAFLVAPIAAAFWSASSAAAQDRDWRLCTTGEAGSISDTVTACSRLLSAKTLKPSDRAALLLNRGGIYLHLGQADRAIADHTAALKIDPGNVVALNRRGEAHAQKGEFERAIADYSEAVRLNPRYPLAFRNRARVHFYRGNFDAAAEDFRTAEEIDPGNGYSLLWRYVAEARAGTVDRAGLHRGAGLVREGWPKPLVLHFLGSVTEAEMLAAAANGDEAAAPPQPLASACARVGIPCWLSERYGLTPPCGPPTSITTWPFPVRSYWTKTPP
jgi:lipoprotein NlpI